jgi:CubicO group peptidase (beta-lactamase class C family)
VLRRVPWAVSVVLWAGAMVAFDVIVAAQDTTDAAAIVRGLGDVVCFGGFFALGAAGHRRRVLVRLPLRWLAALGFATAAVGWAWWRPPVDMVVNNSFVLFTLVGLAWLAAVLALEDRLRHLSTVGPIAVIVGWATRWAMSIYLWHTLALVLTYYLVGAPQSLGEAVMFAAVFALLLPLLLSVVRVFEGLSRRGRRPPRPHPAVVVALLATLVLLAGQSSLFPTLSGGYTPPVPSGHPPIGGTSGAVLASPRDVARQARDASSWIEGNDVEAMGYAEIGSATREQVVTRGLGNGEVLDPKVPFEALSLTKTMVAAVALQLVDEGRLTLDEALPDVTGIPSEVTEALTLRRLLAHATGLIDYRLAPGYAGDSQLTSLAAIGLAVSASDLTSTKVEYAATNFLLVGLVLEEVTGQRLDQLLNARIIGPLGLTSTRLIDNSREGFVGFASGGLVSTLPDLARWFDALLRQRVVLPRPMMREMLYGGRRFQEASGLGMWRLCPCTTPTRKSPEPFTLAFHDGGDTRVVYIPSRDVVLAMRFSEPLYDERQLAQRLPDVTFAIADRRKNSK